MNDRPILIDLAALKPHPANPRLVEREDVITAIEQQIRESGFDPSHAIIVRPTSGGYQIISGHNRTYAAKRAGLKQIPAWVREMDDETAFMQLVLSNAQGELSPLERGAHALAATEKGKHAGRSIDAYARAVGRAPQTVHTEVRAARVAEISPQGGISLLVNRTKHLAEIHAAPESCWPALVERLVDNQWTVEETNAAVKAVRTAKPPRGYEQFFAIEKLQQLVARDADWAETVKISIRAIERARTDIRDVQFADEEYAAQFEVWLTEHGGWNYKAITAEAQRLTEIQRALRQEAEAKAAKLKRAITLAEWKTLSSGERQAALTVINPKAHLIKQTTGSIEWARFSWNPVTGCEHNCPYCYARDLAERFYPQKFVPSLVPETLSAPLNAKPPKQAESEIGYKNIFTCSMADLFGNWVPQEWIQRVLEIVCECPEWNFLMLTKFPQRLAEFTFPENVWVGTTVDLQARVPNAERALRKVKANVKWVSIEPMIEPIEMDFSLVQWVVIGGASKSEQTPEWKPPREWVVDVTARALKAGCAVYHKDNLNLERLCNYPGGLESSPTIAPDVFHYLGQAGDLVNISLGKKRA